MASERQNTMSLQAITQPVILLGMHRSGTAMVARLLDELGLFQGAELQEDHESTWFLDINDLLLERVDAAWDHPAPIRGFLENALAFDLTARCLEEDFRSKLTRTFLGRRRAMKYKSILKMDQPWGWKDPRTIFTLPLWLRMFPGAKLVYIVRNGIDVAKSLRAREKGELDRRIAEFDGKKASGKRSKLQRAGFKGSARCLTMEGGFSLWEEYVAEAERTLAARENARLVVRYESFLADPVAGLTELAKFCGVDSSGEKVAAAVAKVGVNPARANAYSADPELAAFYARVRDNRWMVHFRYGG